MSIFARLVPLVVLLCMAMTRIYAAPIFCFGMSRDYTVVPDSEVEVLGALRNASDAPVAFPAEFTGGEPSEQGGSLPGAGISRGRTEDQWEVIDLWDFGRIGDSDHFFPQFEGVVVAPGATFTFVLGHFTAPRLAAGTPSEARFDFVLNLTDDVRAATFIFGGGFNFVNSPNVHFTLGQAPAVSKMVFRQLCVLNQPTQTVLAGPKGCSPQVGEPASVSLQVPEPVSVSMQVPEPASLSLVALGLCGALVARRRKDC